MADITEHDAEKERECDACEDGRIELLVPRYAVEINQLLERPCEIVQSEVSRGRSIGRRRELLQLPSRKVRVVHLQLCQAILDFLSKGIVMSTPYNNVLRGNPELPDKDIALHLELVQLYVQSLFSESVQSALLDHRASRLHVNAQELVQTAHDLGES
jgi:hypothetical protein